MIGDIDWLALGEPLRQLNDYPFTPREMTNLFEFMVSGANLLATMDGVATRADVLIAIALVLMRDIPSPPSRADGPEDTGGVAA